MTNETAPIPTTDARGDATDLDQLFPPIPDDDVDGQAAHPIQAPDPTVSTDPTDPTDPTTATTATTAASQVGTAPPVGHLPGVAPTPIIIGLIGLLTLAGCAVWSLTDWSVNWALAAPVGIVVLGLVIVVLGVAGLRRPRA